MPNYMLILGGADLDKRSANPEIAPVMLERYLAWIQELRERGQYVSSHKLEGRTGQRLASRDGTVVDGPFVETNEVVGGIFIVEADSLEEATEIARACPNLDLQNGYVEVRPIEVIGRDAGSQ
jgi:hypothetical protein